MLDKLPLSLDTRYFPALVGAGINGMLLLFFKELTPNLREVFVPSLFVYVLCSSFVGYLQTMWHVRGKLADGQNHKGIKSWQWRTILGLHIFLIVSFVAYNAWKSVL